MFEQSATGVGPGGGVSGAPTPRVTRRRRGHLARRSLRRDMRAPSIGSRMNTMTLWHISIGEFAALAAAALLVGFSKTAVSGANTVSLAIFAAVLPARASTGVLLPLLIVGDVLAVLTCPGGTPTGPRCGGCSRRSPRASCSARCSWCGPTTGSYGPRSARSCC